MSTEQLPERLRAACTPSQAPAPGDAGVVEAPDVAKLRSAVNLALTYFGMDEDESNREVFNALREAYSAAAKPPSIDDAMEAVRRAFCKLPRYSFHLDNRGNVRRVADKCGNWIEFDQGHELFDPVMVDAALAAARSAQAQGDDRG